MAGVGAICCRLDAVQPSPAGAGASAGLSLKVFSGVDAAGVSGRAAAAGAGTCSIAGAADRAGAATAAGAAAETGTGLPHGSSGTFVTTVRGMRTV